MPTTAVQPRTELPSRTASREPVQSERARIARELHDGVAQTLYAIVLAASHGLELAEVPGTANSSSLFNRVLQLAKDAQVEVRQLLSDLWSDEPTHTGAVAALSQSAAEQPAVQRTRVRLTLRPEPDISAAGADALVRIAREALRNVARHASAEHVDLVFEESETELSLLIADDGRGFSSSMPRPGHFGLRSMRERAEAVGGRLEMISAEGRGTQILLRVPRGGR
jgi:signal transduction histidine kinase